MRKLRSKQHSLKYQPFILVILLLTACTSKQRENNQVKTRDSTSVQSKNLDTVPVIDQNQIISNEFLHLVEYIDSSGYIGDSTRYRKTYRPVNRDNQLTINRYNFYSLSLDKTVPITEHYTRFERRSQSEEERNDSIHLKLWNEDKERWMIKKHLLDKVDTIIAYFYVEKSLLDGTGNGTYFDGIIEEWQFPDTSSAKLAAIDLANKETRVYTNRGAYICYMD